MQGSTHFAELMIQRFHTKHVVVSDGKQDGGEIEHRQTLVKVGRHHRRSIEMNFDQCTGCGNKDEQYRQGTIDAGPTGHYGDQMGGDRGHHARHS